MNNIDFLKYPVIEDEVLYEITRLSEDAVFLRAGLR
jgi:hypothetical protein